MSDNTFPPNGPEGRPPQQGPYGGPPQQNPYGPPPGQYGPPQQNPYGGPPQQNPYGPPPGQYGPPPQQNPYGPPGQQYGGPPGQPPYGPPPQGQQPYGQPQGPEYTETLQWQPERRRKRGKLVPLIAALAVLLVLGGGGAFAYSRIAGGDQPAAVLPGNSLGYVRVDLNPSAGQKVAALRFLRKFPSVRDELGLTSDNDDLKQKLFDFMKKSAGDDLEDVNFDTDVKPWLGDRIGVAAVPADGNPDTKEPDAVIAIQVTDETKASAGLDKLFAKEKEKPGKAFLNGYAVLAEDQARADKAVAAAKQSPLSENDTFAKDMDELGEQGFASAWVDTKGIATLAGDELTEEQRKALPQGSVAVALRFDAQYVEVKGIVHGDKNLKPGKSNAEEVVTNLPDNTAGALAVADGETLVDRIWEQVQKASQSSGIDLTELANKFGEQYGVTIPADIKLLLGKNFAVSVDKSAGSDGPQVAAKMKTDPAKAEPVVDKIIAAARNQTGEDIPIKKAKDGETLVVATTQQYADQVLQGGNLGDTESFKLAVPEAKGSVMLGYVDFTAIESLVPQDKDNADLKVLRAAGVTSQATGDGEGEFTLRVVAK
jgi:Protein of unknown function (DUF3352)